VDRLGRYGSVQHAIHHRVALNYFMAAQHIDSLLGVEDIRHSPSDKYKQSDDGD
jgi:hypothetical protein